jgi:hypothetical protein
MLQALESLLQPVIELMGRAVNHYHALRPRRDAVTIGAFMSRRVEL